MEFNVIPTSGEGPYTLNIVFSEKHLIDNVAYTFRLRSSSATGSCSAPGSGNISSLTGILLANNTALVDTTVAAGSCLAYTAEIVNAENVVISSEYVTINNV